MPSRGWVFRHVWPPILSGAWSARWLARREKIGDRDPDEALAGGIIPGMAVFPLNVNGKRYVVEATPEMPLLWALRDLLRLTGTKYGCGIGVCGACTVHEDGAPVRSCQVRLSSTAGKNYLTIEGLSAEGDHPCQKAWLEEDVAQCGYCQGGMIMEAAALIRRTPRPTDEDLDAVMSAHVCRCGTYQRMRRAIHLAAGEVNRT